MRKIDLVDVIHPNNGMAKDAQEIKTQALKQISRGRYEIVEGHVETIIEVNSERIIVEVDDKVSPHEFRELTHGTCKEEPSLIYLGEKTFSPEETSLVKLLQEYKDKNLIKGSELEGAVWFKLYNLKDTHDPYRESYRAKWIDYEKQLTGGNIIYDSYELNGLWAMPENMMSRCINTECFDRYGDHLLIVKPLADEYYLLDGKEIIGPRYVVEEKLNLTNPDDIGQLFIRLEKIKAENAEKENDEIRAELRKEKQEKVDAVDQLIAVDEIASQFRRQRILFAIIGFVLGIIIRSLM